MCKHESKHTAPSADGRRFAQVGAQVMLLKNLDLTSSSDQMLVNGSRGVVRRHMPARVLRSVVLRQ